MMQPVTMFSFNIPRNKNVSFKGGADLAAMDEVLSLRACKLVKRAGKLIDDTWPKVKKSRLMTVPEFVSRTKDKTVILKPVYNFDREKLYLEIQDKKYIEKVIIDRVNPNKFSYEKSVKTDYGSATIKTYNSQNGHNAGMAEKVSGLIEEYFKKFVK